MDRRTYLAGASAGVTGALAGCLDEFIDAAPQGSRAASVEDTDAEFDVEITDTYDGIDGGDWLVVIVIVMRLDDHEGRAKKDVKLKTGDIVVDERCVRLERRERKKVSIGYKTCPVKRDITFPVTVSVDDKVVKKDVEVKGVDKEPDDPDHPHVDVDIVDTNAPVAGGDELTVTAEVTNTGDRSVDEPVEMVVGNEVVDSATVGIDAGATETVTLGYETYPVQRDVEFPIDIVGKSDVDRITVTVYAEGTDLEDPDDDDSDDESEARPITVGILEAEQGVTGGEWMGVYANVANNGEADTEATFELVVGDEVVDTTTEFLEGHSTHIVELGYKTYPVRQDTEVTVEVRSADDSDSTTVTVLGTEESDDDGDDDPTDSESGISAEIRETNASVTGGEWLDVVVGVGSVGSGGEDTVELLVGGDVVDSETVGLGPESTRHFEMGYETYPVETDVQVTLEVRTSSSSDEKTVMVYGSG